ncbi:MAG: protein translocase subunit SecD [Atribacterota bacterium]|jgi:preprotein translocase subunit SecD|nr:protein translocase subunit SecD [Atribacterota bacterium]MDD4288610.1 protein translocase subunit SecD [Atribacterota bacterium]
MKQLRMIRLALIILVIVIAIFYAFPLEKNINLGLDLQGGSHIVLECVDTPNAPVDSDAVNRVIEIITNRINPEGVKEPVIQRQGERRILVQLPGMDDPQEAENLIGKTALLEFKDESGETLLTGAHLKNASSSFDRFGRPNVVIEFDEEGAKLFEQATMINVGRILAITLDGQEISSPVVEEPIPSGEASIVGQFSVEEAQRLALLLRSGALPVEVQILENRSVGPTLGKDSIDRGLKAGLIGLILILIFMVIYYKGFGLVADLSLGICLLLVMGGLAILNATLTLPGIGGIILTIGMAVDANILIFERIKEELKMDKTFRASIDAGFSKAFRTILDANITTLIAAVALLYFGTGPIRGFAVTLSIGIAVSMFTAIIVTKLILELMGQRFKKNALI